MYFINENEKKEVNILSHAMEKYTQPRKEELELYISPLLQNLNLKIYFHLRVDK